MKSKAFTLIELLVVISIIGVLSSVIFVSFSGSRDKAKLAKAQNFDAQVSHALGAYAVGIWRFEEGSGIDIHDESGFGNDGIMGNGACTPGSGSCPSWAIGQGVYSGTNALSFDGNDYVNCGNDPSLNLGDGGNKGTVELWVKVNSWAGGYPSLVAKGTGAGWNAGSYHISTWNGNIRFIIYNSSNQYDSINLGTPTTGAWHHLAMAWSGVGGTLEAFIDGVSVGSTSQRYKANKYLGSALLIGRNGSHYFNGSIDNVSVYDEALSSAQIQQHYATGAASHGIAVND